LAGLTESPAVVCDDSVTGIEKGPKLLLPRRSVQWIPVNKHHGLACAMIFIEKIDVAGIFFANSNERHLRLSFLSSLVVLLEVL
jgi:hypothetical protein